MRKRAIYIFGCIWFFVISISHAQTWSQYKRLTWNSGNSISAAVKANSSNVHMVWMDDFQGNYEIYYKRSSDGGTTWGGFKRLTYTSNDSGAPALALDASGNTIHVVWTEKTIHPLVPVIYSISFEIYYKRSTDGGNTWSSARPLTWISQKSQSPSIVVDSNNTVHVVWYYSPRTNDNMIYEIFYKQSPNGGASWNATQRLTWSSGHSESPDIAVSFTNTIHVVWLMKMVGNTDLFYKRSTNGGVSWTGAKRITWTSGFNDAPKIVTDSGNNLHIVWPDNSPSNYEIYHKKSTDGGLTWPGIQRLTYTTGNTFGPELAVNSSNHVFLCWYDITPGNNEIFFKQSTNGGGAWSPVTRLTWNPTNSNSPFLTLGAGNSLHVVYTDVFGSNEILYKNRN